MILISLDILSRKPCGFRHTVVHKEKNMAKVSKKKTFTAKGIINVEGDKIAIEVEDIENPIVLSDYVKDFDGKEVSISFSQIEDIL